MQIGTRRIGPGHPPLIVAELGISHGGSLTQILRAVPRLADVGVEAIKLQAHIPDAEMVPGHPWAATVARCSLSEPDERRAFEAAAAAGLVCFSTPFSVPAVARLERIGTPAYKIGSGEAEFTPLLDAVRATGKPWLVSCGMGADWEVLSALGGVVMHCVSEYPTRPERWDLRRMEAIAEHARSNGIAWGYSDHSTSIVPVLHALALGASVVELHTSCDDGQTETPDECVEWSWPALGRVVEMSRRVWESRTTDLADPGAEVARLCARDASGRRVAV